MPWDLETIGAAASLVGGAVAMLARAVSRKKALDYRIAWIAIRAIRIAAGSSRTMLIGYRQEKGRWLATILAESCADGVDGVAGAPSIAGAWTDAPVDDDYVKHVIQPREGRRTRHRDR